MLTPMVVHEKVTLTRRRHVTFSNEAFFIYIRLLLFL